eukprot:CAMPEP_0171172302 /NCGR_PEP_ID=MMETSP0790-20130122/9652_1 /TAXON_ID=2925 /ORGANISM="Alexandrium catenella, Strain OF101" /LENGTH=158 /DNA_ID=CAMNT_0011637161 /DNA_START=78 /DNA_END=551 /DNA_ORIENTATION=+
MPSGADLHASVQVSAPPVRVDPRVRSVPRLVGGNVQKFDLEDEVGVGRYRAAGAPGTVGIVRGNPQYGFLAQGHSLHALVPALDHLTDAALKAERDASLDRGVHLLPRRRDLAIVVHPQLVPGLGVGAPVAGLHRLHFDAHGARESEGRSGAARSRSG